MPANGPPVITPPGVLVKPISLRTMRPGWPLVAVQFGFCRKFRPGWNQSRGLSDIWMLSLLA